MSTEEHQESIDSGAILLRIRHAMDARRLTIRVLADRTAVPYSSLRSYLDGRHAMPADVAARVARTLEVSCDWLLSGAPAFDQAPLAMCLRLIEDVRVLSDHKVGFDECAVMFSRFYASEIERSISPPPPRRPARHSK